MAKSALTRALILENGFIAAHGARETARRAGLNLRFDTAASTEEYFSCLQSHGLDLIVAGGKGFSDYSLAAILEHCRALRPPVPVIVIGEDDDQQNNAVQTLRMGATDFVHSSELHRLPAVLERALREQEARNLHAYLQEEVDHAADVLRENQKLVTIGRLTASIAHEINNPLESVTNLLFLIDMVPNLPEAAHTYLDLAQKELSRVVQIARQTLNFYRETATAVRTHLSTLVEEVLVLYARRIADKKLEVMREFDYDEPVTVFPGEMRQVFSNLIINAIEASSPGGKLRVRSHRTRQWSDHEVTGIRISIGDTGSGIDSEARQRLGEPFFTTKGQRGTGLGLWVTQSIIRRYGGNLQLHSSTAPQHHGTVFSVFLPTNMRPHAVGSSPESTTTSGARASAFISAEDFRGESDTRQRASGD